MTATRALSVLAFLGWLAACGSDDTSGPDCDAADAPTYETFGQAFVRDYCTRCHSVTNEGAARGGATEGVDFDTLEGVRANRSEIVRLAVDSTEMPFGSGDKPTDEERELLGAWLGCGAP